ncbi:MAG: methyltransferase domain-containing protein [Methanoregulaceae archaeon]|nr:methyltransferase domain-containing protein [Methanoregulaceae archaeon]
MENGPPSYVHGRSERESERLHYQASRLAYLLHHDTRYPAGSRVLEAACGVGAQTLILAKNSPGAEFISVDISPESLVIAEEQIKQEGVNNVTFCEGDIYHLPFEKESFDHVFVCFLLEHLENPLRALEKLRDFLIEGGTITVIEGDHGSALFYPDSRDAHRVIDCLVTIQRQMGGNAMIGRELWHLLNDAGYTRVTVSPRQVYADSSRPEYIEGVRNIFIAMVEGVRKQALDRGLIDTETWEKGIRDLYRTTENSGTFSYTFFKAVGIREGR